MSGDALHILLALSDDKLVHDIAQKIRNRFELINVQIDVLDDGKRAAAEFRNRRHSIVIVGRHLPGIDGLALVEEIRKIDGAISIFLVGAEGEAINGVESVSAPIVNWTEFLNRIQTAIPDDLKAKYGLFERNSQLFEKVVEYAKKYRMTSAQQAEPIICIPSFYEARDAGAISLSAVQKKSLEQKSIIFKQLAPSERRRVLRADLMVLGSLLAVTGLVFYFLRDSPFDSIFSIKGVCAGLSCFSVFGFFIGHALERFLFASDIEVN